MPRAYLSRKDRLINNIGAWVDGQIRKYSSRKEVAEELDITVQALSYKILHNTFTYGDLITIFDVLGTPEDEILELLKL